MKQTSKAASHVILSAAKNLARVLRLPWHGLTPPWLIMTSRVLPYKANRLKAIGGICASAPLWLTVLALLFLLSSPALADPRTYTVQPGDSLVGIAERFHTTTEELRNLNRLTDADLLRIGQELIVVPGERTYRIASSQTLVDIGAIYGVSPAQLAAMNRSANPALTPQGEEAVIPRRETAALVSNPGAPRTRLWVPYRTQFDGSPYDQANCGPVALAMLMAYYGEHWSTASIRRSIAEHSGTDDYDAGSTWEDMAYAAWQRGFTTLGLFDGMGGYKKWTFEQLMESVAKGDPVLVLVRFWGLPGHQEKAWYGDHYIIFMGVNEKGDVVYHDPAWRGDQGANLTMSREQFDRAWSRVSVGTPYTGVVLGW